MIKIILSDLARVMLYPKDKNYTGELNYLHKQLVKEKDYSFGDHFFLDEEIFIFYEGLKDDYKLYMFTSGIIQDVEEITDRLQGLFEVIFSAEKMGMTKRDKEAYEKIIKEIGVEPDEILFIDDSITYINPAKEAGMKTYHFKELDELKKVIG